MVFDHREPAPPLCSPAACSDRTRGGPWGALPAGLWEHSSVVLSAGVSVCAQSVHFCNCSSQGGHVLKLIALNRGKY